MIVIVIVFSQHLGLLRWMLREAETLAPPAPLSLPLLGFSKIDGFLLPIDRHLHTSLGRYKDALERLPVVWETYLGDGWLQLAAVNLRRLYISAWRAGEVFVLFSSSDMACSDYSTVLCVVYADVCPMLPRAIVGRSYRIATAWAALDAIKLQVAINNMDYFYLGRGG